MNQDSGLWPLGILDSAVMVIFAVSVFHPGVRRDWRAVGGYSAFTVALFHRHLRRTPAAEPNSSTEAVLTWSTQV